jgi:hypothetical protein
VRLQSGRDGKRGAPIFEDIHGLARKLPLVGIPFPLLLNLSWFTMGSAFRCACLEDSNVILLVFYPFSLVSWCVSDGIEFEGTIEGSLLLFPCLVVCCLHAACKEKEKSGDWVLESTTAAPYVLRFAPTWIGFLVELAIFKPCIVFNCAFC